MKHFYFDQGGLLGTPIFLLSDVELKYNGEDECHISNFYVGHIHEYYARLWVKQLCDLYNCVSMEIIEGERHVCSHDISWKSLGQ